MYLLISVLRGVRNDFATEIWADLQLLHPADGIAPATNEVEPSRFWQTEVVIGLAIMLSSLTVCIRSNRVAFLTAIALRWRGLSSSSRR